jgi:hypothetical protein
MLKSALKKKYLTSSSFLKSLDTTRKKPQMTKEDVDDLSDSKIKMKYW